MSIQANINNILSLTGLIAAGTEARREKQKEKKTEETREAAIRGNDSIEATLVTTETARDEVTGGETQQAPTGIDRYNDLIELSQRRSSGSPLARERTRQVAQELGMTEAQFATAMSQSNMSQIRERAALRRGLAQGMTREERIRTAGLRQAAAGGDTAAADELRAVTGGTT